MTVSSNGARLCWKTIAFSIFENFLSLQDHVAKKLMKRLSNVRSPRKAKVPSSKKPQQEVNLDIDSTDYDADSSASTIILERSSISPKGIPVDVSPRASTSTRNTDPHQDSSDEEGIYFIKFELMHMTFWTLSSFGFFHYPLTSFCTLLSSILLPQCYYTDNLLVWKSHVPVSPYHPYNVFRLFSRHHGQPENTSKTLQDPSRDV